MRDQTVKQRDRVRQQLLEELGAAGSIAVATLYRSLMNRFGSEAIFDVGASFSQLIRDGEIEIDSQQSPFHGVRIAYARLALRVQPPYHCLMA
jgi:hypothetical protein